MPLLLSLASHLLLCQALAERVPQFFLPFLSDLRRFHLFRATYRAKNQLQRCRAMPSLSTTF
jgi:hypothetical protein